MGTLTHNQTPFLSPSQHKGQYMTLIDMTPYLILTIGSEV